MKVPGLRLHDRSTVYIHPLVAASIPSLHKRDRDEVRIDGASYDDRRRT